MSLVGVALRTALDRFVRFAPKIVLFALIVFVVQLVVRSTAAVFERFGLIWSIGIGLLAFVLIVYLSFVAIRFSFRTLERPVFDFSLDAKAVFHLAIAELALLLISLPSLLIPLSLVLSLAPQLPSQVPWFLGFELAPSVSIALLPLAALSVFLLVRFSMTGFRIVVLAESASAAFLGSWEMTRRAFVQLLIYSLIPLSLIIVLAALLVLISLPLAVLGPLGIAAIALAAVVCSLGYLLVIDPSLAIGKAKLFDELSGHVGRNTHKDDKAQR